MDIPSMNLPTLVKAASPHYDWQRNHDLEPEPVQLVDVADHDGDDCPSFGVLALVGLVPDFDASHEALFVALVAVANAYIESDPDITVDMALAGLRENLELDQHVPQQDDIFTEPDGWDGSRPLI
jgi:hypothetical protein